MNFTRTNIFEIITDIVLTDFSGKKYFLTGKKAEVTVLSLIIYESVESPYLTGEISISDNGVNLIGSVPIYGFEQVTFGIQTPYFSEKEYKFDFRVAAVRNRSGVGKLQTYTLDLISYEGLQNESLRIGKAYADYGHNIVKDIMTTYFKTSKSVDVEECKYRMKMIPRNQRPFDLIYSFLTKCITNKTPNAPAQTSNSSVGKGKEEVNKGQTNATPDKKLSGSSGYFFWETYDGYKFKSIDTLCSLPNTPYQGSKVKDTFEYKIARVEGNTDPGRSILEYQYTSEIDVMKKMRYGTYSSMMVFFNPSTGQYEEFQFDINQSYAGMAHLGKDEKIPEGPKQLSKYPTRIMSQFLDSETFYNGVGIASPEPTDNPDGSSAYPDYAKYYMAQSISRKLLLSNQELNVTINGNLTLRSGDKINILLPNYSSESLRTGDQYDKQHSGTYLIKNISYEFYLQKNGQNNIAVTNMNLVRDSFGLFTLDIKG